MDQFLQQHDHSVTGILRGWDRLRFRGTQRMLAHVQGLSRFLQCTRRLIKDFGDFARQASRQIRAASLEVAELANRPVIHLDSPKINKEQVALGVARQDGIQQGLVAAITAVESCQGFDVRSVQSEAGKKLVELYPRPRKCQHIYHYMIHPVFGWCYARLQTWLPFTMFIGVNGREWLGRQMDAAGIKYLRQDNCFPWVGDIDAAQQLLDQQVKWDWPGALGQITREVNPALGRITAPIDLEYYWSLEQSEWANDVMFKDRLELDRLYPNLVRHAMESFDSPSVMRFLGRRVHKGINPAFNGQVISDLSRRVEGTRVKHSVNHNSVKMYNKAGSVLRVETTLNDMRDMRAARQVKGEIVWRPMRKGVADLPRRAEVSDASNRRYLEALAAVETPLPLKDLTGKLSDRVKFKNQHVRGLNLLGPDSQLLRAIGGGEFLINGFRNRDVQAALFKTPADDAAIKRKRSGQVTRKLRLLRAHGLIQKVPHTHRYMVSPKGRQVIAAIHAAAEADIQKLIAAA